MRNNNPFGLPPESTAERYLREERERIDRYENMLGGGTVVQAIREATQQSKLLRGLDFDAPHRHILDTLARERESQKAFKELTSTAWALSVQETAGSIVRQNQDLLDQQRHLGSTALETIRAFDLNRGVVATAIAVAKADDRYRSMIAEALPRFTMFSAIAERMLMVDALTLRASEGGVQSATAIAASAVIEAQRIAEAIAQAQDEEQSARLYGSLLDLFVEFFSNLGPNTIPELRKMGLVGFISFVITVLSAYSLVPQTPEQSPQDKAAFVELNQRVERLRSEVQAYHEAETETDERYLAGLPRAVLVRSATLRRTPARDGQVVLKGAAGMQVAIAETRGRWKLVTYRDPLSTQLARAWVYGSAVMPLAEPLEADEE